MPRFLLSILSSAAVVGLLFDVKSLFSASYDELRSAAVTKCQAIDPAEYQSGLFFNPDGYRSYYVRSECFQRTAVQFRDEALCTEVRQRFSLLSSSWGYSRARCRELVGQGVATDRTTLEEIKRLYIKGAVTLRDFRIEKTVMVATSISFPSSLAVTRMATFCALRLFKRLPAKKLRCYIPRVILWTARASYESFSGRTRFASAFLILRSTVPTQSARH